MAKTKTAETEKYIYEFILEFAETEQKRQDSHELVKLMEKVSGFPAKMWGPSIIGFGSYHYKYESGREGDWMVTGFSPRKNDLTLYIMPGFARYEDLMARLGKHKTGKSCLYINKLSDVDLDALEGLVKLSWDVMNERYPD